MRVSVRESLFLAIALLANGVLLRGAEPLPGHSAHGETFNEGPRQAAVLTPGMGKVSFKISSKNEDAQKFFNQGVGQLHGFWYYEAERSFRQVAALDPECAMAYWGMAMANVNNETRATAFIEKAIALKAKASAAEKLWIGVLETFYKKDKRDKKQRALDCIRDLENIVQEYPEDVEAKAFLIWKIWQAKEQAPISSPQAVDALLDQVFAVNPEHPAHHYRIHLWDGSKPARALKSAAQNGQVAPAIAHMWHMPGHTFSKVKRPDDAAWQQEASTRVDHVYMIRNWILPDQIHNYAHNEEWLVRTYNELGRAREAIDLAKSLIKNPLHPQYNNLEKGSTRYGQIRLLETLAQWELWDELLAVSSSPWISLGQEGLKMGVFEARAQAFFAQKDVAALEAVIVELEALNQKAIVKHQEDKAKKAKEEKAKAKPADGKTEAKAKRVEEKKYEGPAVDTLKNLRAFSAVLNSRRDAGTFIEAAKSMSKEQTAFLWLQLGDRPKAESLIKNFSQDLRGSAAKAELYFQLGNKEEAKKALQQTGKHAFTLEAGLPLSQRLDSIAQEVGIKSWKAAAPVRKDSGVRPDQKTLGPLYWQPPGAPEWTLVDLAGAQVKSSQLKGKPHLLLFYLGSTCSHCMEQVNAFAKASEAYKKAGIQIAAITQEKPDDAVRVREQMSTKKLPPFPIWCDPEHQVFKAFKAYDDFESEPLHAAILVDAEGNVRWWDISWKPFMDSQFLLNESHRLLALDKL